MNNLALRNATIEDFLKKKKYDKTVNNSRIDKNQKHYGERKRIKP